MKVYVHDLGWKGALVVVAESYVHALKLFNEKGFLIHVEESKIRDYLEEYEIGTVIETVGDA